MMCIFMKADVELLFLPYAGAAQGTVADVLIRELRSGKWTIFRAAVAFARESGNFRELLDALVDFTAEGAALEMTFGANTFAEGEGSDYAAIETLLEELEKYPNARLNLYSEPDRTFHPKMFIFSNDTEAFLLIGSSNWTHGGLVHNVEANVIIRLSLAEADQRTAFDDAVKIFDSYWKEGV
jgi:HKD family nuclease